MATVQIRRVAPPVQASGAFPQANSLPRLLDVLAAACHSPKLDEGVLAGMFGITERQGSYYYGAAHYVGLVYKRGGWIKATAEGDRVNAIQDEAARRDAVFGAILELPVFDEAGRHLAEFGELPSAEAVSDWVRGADAKVNHTTAARRADTVLSWIGMIRRESPERIEALAPAPPARRMA